MKTVTVNSDNKDDAYVATIHYFTAVQQMSHDKVGGWCIKQCYTSVTDDHYVTEYTNGKVWIKAVSIEGNHTYCFGVEDNES